MAGHNREMFDSEPESNTWYSYSSYGRIIFTILSPLANTFYPSGLNPLALSFNPRPTRLNPRARSFNP